MSYSARALAALLLVAPALAACSGASDLADRAREVLEEAADPQPSGEPGASDGYPESAVLSVSNETDGDLCDLQITDFDEPDNEGYDLLATPLPPGESRDFPYGSHAKTDDHNLIVTPVGCDGTEYHGYHFSYHNGGASYIVDPGNEADGGATAAE